MEILRDENRLSRVLDKFGIKEFFGTSKPRFLLLHYAPGELLTTAFARTEYLFFVVEGNLALYDMPDEESVVKLETDFKSITMIGEIELFDMQYESYFVEAETDVVAVALNLEEHREMLLNDPKFLVYVCRSLETKLTGAVASAYGGTLRQKVERRIKRLGSGAEIRNVGELASFFGVSNRQLLRVLKALTEEGILEHMSRGSYRIL